MSFAPTTFRQFALGGWGGRAAWRGLQATDSGKGCGQGCGQIGTVIYRSPGVVANTSVVGVTRNGAGTPVGSCMVHLYQSGNDAIVKQIQSDGAGGFRFDQPGSGPFYLVAYKAGSPDIAGTSVNTLIAS